MVARERVAMRAKRSPTHGAGAASVRFYATGRRQPDRSGGVQLTPPSRVPSIPTWPRHGGQAAGSEFISVIRRRQSHTLRTPWV
jgi:hypothetical protein